MILLYSGGLDSFIAWHYLNKPKTLYLSLGHRYTTHEIAAIKKTIPDTIIDTRLDLADWEEKDANIPLRNAFLIMIASKYDKDVVLVVQRGEMNIPDRSVYFFNRFGEWLTFLWGEGATLSTPFFHMTKTEMVRWFLKEVKNKTALLSTRSCFSPGDSPCGNCAACFRRWVAFINNDIGEEYENDITKYSGIPDYIDKMKRKRYDRLRTEETFAALKKVGIL
jgi:7-cyano-7-deazaguanine synthase in queuosine biosynthesis